ncbi:MAG TPA: aspartate aminotransferase family protein [Bacteroidales bacterium]|nr:aspartate aminotransferase family protein [Bacteroidales bacterium]
MTERELFYRYLGLPARQPLGLEFDKAEGVWLYGRNGKKYLDLVSGVSVSNIGHRHPAVISAIEEQLGKYLYLTVYGEYIQSPQVRLAKMLADLLPPGLDSVYFVNSGSEAIEGAVKLAKRVTGRTEVISFHGGYHGSTQGALSILGNEVLKNAFRPLIPGNRLIRFNRPDELDRITEKTACVVAETIQAEAGIILPDAGYLSSLRNRCSETGALLVIDDVQMGFGRTGKLFSFGHWDVVPDILVLAKALGGGMPLGAFISSADRMNALSHDPELGHITTFGGHPVSCAAALASLKVLTETILLESVGIKGDMFYHRLKDHPEIREIRYKGLMMGIELKRPELRQPLTEKLLEEGIVTDWYLFRPDTFRIAPPLVISREEIEQACEAIIRAFSGCP